MSIETKVKKAEKFAVAVPNKGGIAIIQTYFTKEELEKGYNYWSSFFTERKLPKPYPVELGKDGEYKVLRNLIKKESA